MTQYPIGIDFDFRHLEVFSKVVELKSFSKAARAVGLAQASVSEKIAVLEERVGIKLLDRLGRQVTTTKAGELLYGHAKALLDMKKRACMELQDFLGPGGGEVRAGASTIPGEYILPSLLGKLRSMNPRIHLILSIAGSGDIAHRVLHGNVEFGIIGSPPSDANLLVHRLWKDELLIVAPAGHPFGEAEEISWEEFSREPFVFRESGSGTLDTIQNHFKSSRLPETQRLITAARLENSTAVKEAVKAGAGISILSARAVETEVRAGLLATARLKDISMTRYFLLVRDRRRTPSPPCEAVLRFLMETAD